MILDDVSSSLDDPAVRDLVALAMFPDPERVDRACARYRADPAWALLGYRERGLVVGCIGLQFEGNGRAVIRHISVLATARRRGLGRRMIRAAIVRDGLVKLEAETDVDSVGFYQRCGFHTASLGERFPGRERFQCIWQADTGDAPTDCSSAVLCSSSRSPATGGQPSSYDPEKLDLASTLQDRFLLEDLDVQPSIEH